MYTEEFKEIFEPYYSKYSKQVEEAAEYLGMSRSWLYQEVERKLIPHLRLGSAIRFNRESIDEWLHQHQIMKCNNT